MARVLVAACLAIGAPCLASGASARTIQSRTLMQSWEASAQTDTPVTRVIKLLQEMSATIQKEADEDEALFHKLQCWCGDNSYEKDEQIAASVAKIEELNSTIESLTARSGELTTHIKELEEGVADNKKTLAEATELRQKQLKEYQESDLDSTQALENLKAAIMILAKKTDVEVSNMGGTFDAKDRVTSKTEWTSLVAVNTEEHRSFPWTDAHEATQNSRSLEDFMRRNGFTEDGHGESKFLQKDASTKDDAAVVRRGLRSAQAFMQAKHRESYFPSYTARSGEIVGVLRQLEEDMFGDVKEAQELEQKRAANFAELRDAKESEIASGEKLAEQKEDELAQTDNDLAEAKEDLVQENEAMGENQRFLANLKTTCADADAKAAERTKVRNEEKKAVAETIAILTSDEARDILTSTYKFVQMSTVVQRTVSKQQHMARSKAAAALRKAALAAKDPKLAFLATAVELDAFTKVKKAIDDMIIMIQAEQKDEVKKNDWCIAELQETDMTTKKTEDHKADLEATEAELASKIETLAKEIADAQNQIQELQVNLQRANEDRKTANIDFQKTVADQTGTVEVLKLALDRLATFYDEEGFVQVKHGQTPPVVQAEYSKNKGAEGVMQMIEKLVQEAKDMTKEAKESEVAAQAAYEQTIADTNDMVASLQKEIVTKTKLEAETKREHAQTGQDIIETVEELEGLAKYTADLHSECDFLMKNFNLRQDAMYKEVEALQQAKMILSGAQAS